MFEYHTADHEPLLKRLQTAQTIEEVMEECDYIFRISIYQKLDNHLADFNAANGSLLFKGTYPAVRQQSSLSLDHLPRKVAFTMQQGTSSLTSMDFHPHSAHITSWYVSTKTVFVY